jgi:hypothetical protein
LASTRGNARPDVFDNFKRLLIEKYGASLSEEQTNQEGIEQRFAWKTAASTSKLVGSEGRYQDDVVYCGVQALDKTNSM